MREPPPYCVGVMVTVQVETPNVAELVSEQVPVIVSVPSEEVTETLPVGNCLVPVSVSVTVTVAVLPTPTGTLVGFITTDTLVVRLATVKAAELLLPA